MEHHEEFKFSATDLVSKKGGKIRDYYRIGKVLGSGAFGEVRLCLHKESQAQRAVKVLRKNLLDDKEMDMLKNEISILKDMDHPNIVKMYEFLEDEKRIYIVTEICKGGELFDEILSRSKFDEKDAAVVMRQLLSAINYCHKKKIVHRDLKPENILLEQDKDLEKLKIVDFGTSQTFDPDRALEEKLGTAYYIAPEVIKKKYNEKCDLWSCGVIMYILLSGEPPFNDPKADNEAIMKKVEKGKYDISKGVWKAVSAEAKDLIKKLLTYDPADRISAEEALKHPWVKECKVELDAEAANNALSNLRGFRSGQKLKVAASAYIGSQLISKSEKEKLGKIFKALDANGDGRLSKEEIRDGYEEHFGKLLNEDELDQIFTEIDTDGNGFIDYSEFIVATMSSKKNLSEEKLMAAFKLFDVDSSGTISPTELKTVLGSSGKISDDVIEEILKQADENNDGEIEFKEF
jgi:calcium-dependent protein kinase